MLTRRSVTSAAVGADGAGGTPSASKGQLSHHVKQRQQPPIPETKGKATTQKPRAKVTDQNPSGGFLGAKLLLLGAVMALLSAVGFNNSGRPSGLLDRWTAGAQGGGTDASLRSQRQEQEARVYELTGSRFFQLPHCPEEPEYPPEVPILDIIGNWNPDDVAIPVRHHSTLCRINYQAERAKAFRYRDAEVPFVAYNVPEFDETVRKWAQPGYLAGRLGPDTKQYPVETSKNNHFTYVAMSQKGRDDYEKATRKELPLRRTEWSYARWVNEGQKTEQTKASGVPTRQLRHGYLYAADDRSGVIEEELTIFSRANASLFVVDPARLNLIECRFAMKGIVTEAHFDRARNMAGAVSGLRRWILAHPRNCAYAHLRPNDDFSARQSLVDFAEPDLVRYPDFAKMQAHEVVLIPGEILHIPPFWLHYVVTLEMGAQCNAHCGFSTVGQDDIEVCGFKQPPIRPPRGRRQQQQQQRNK